MPYRICKSLEVENGHMLAKHPDKCRFPHGHTRKIEFIPFTLDPFTPMAAADVAIMCSQRECFPRVNIEAMKLGKPVVAADSDGTAEAVIDGFNGFRFRLGDPASLAEKLEILHANRDLLARMGAQARAWATREFHVDRHYRALIGVLDEARACR